MPGKSPEKDKKINIREFQRGGSAPKPKEPKKNEK
jgi:hypothetical protein